MFSGRMESGTRITFDELGSSPTQVLAARAPDFDSAFSVFTFEGLRRIVHVADNGSMEAAEAAIRVPT